MRVLDSSLDHISYNTLQFLRGALRYARQNWWMALSLAYVFGSAIYELVEHGNATSLYAVAVTALAFLVWFVYRRKLGIAKEDEVLQYQIVALILLLLAPSFFDSFTDSVPGFVTGLWLLGFSMTLPWWSRVKSSAARMALLFVGFVGAIVAGIIAQICVYGW
jgi:hypothetical protein